VPATILAAALYRGYRFPPEIISYAVWLYLRFSLSLRDVEELLAERGVAVTYKTIGQWVRRFGPVFAQELRRDIGNQQGLRLGRSSRLLAGPKLKRSSHR
jgi:transposase-like protein